MSKYVSIAIVGAIVACGMAAVGYMAGAARQSSTAMVTAVNAQSTGAPVSGVNRQEVEGIVRNYLLNHPEIFHEMQQAAEAKQEEQQRVVNVDVIKQNKDLIFASEHDAVIGNPNGKVTIVEFYDYNCGYCKRAQADMLTLTKTNPDLRFVLKEFPILGPDSRKAHVVSQAFRNLMPSKFEEFHNKLIEAQGRATEDSAVKLAVSLGADEQKLRDEMKNPDIAKSFAETYKLATQLNINGTPSYVIGQEVIFGAAGAEDLTDKIAAVATACGGKPC